MTSNFKQKYFNQNTLTKPKNHPISNKLSIELFDNKIENLVDEIDRLLSAQLDEILHHADYQSLESTWIGTKQQCTHANNQSDISIRILPLSQKFLLEHISQTDNFHQSKLYSELYHAEFNMPGGTPYDLLIADYNFSYKPTDINCLNFLADIGQDCLMPVISAASCKLFQIDSWDQLQSTENLAEITSRPEYIQWNALRTNQKSQFLCLTAPRYLGRLTYNERNSSNQFNYFENIHTEHDYCWINSAFALSRCIIQAYIKYGWCTAIRGRESGGLVSNIPLTHTLKATENTLSDLSEHALSQQGLVGLCHYKNTDNCVFFASETLHRPSEYDCPQATANAKISARLPYVLASSRFAHYLKVIARDKIGAFLQKDEVETWLNRWILQYVNANEKARQSLKAKFPLAEAFVKVSEAADNPGHFSVTMHLKPWLQLESLSASLRLVTDIPNGKDM